MIRVDNLTKIYPLRRRGEQPILAVDHISFTVQAGEVFGFLGPNGAGKTTTHRMLATLLAPTEGTITIDEHDLARDAYEAKRRMGLVPEESNVYTELSAWDNLLFTGRLYRVPTHGLGPRAQELLTLFGLWERRHDKVETFSRGMRRRLSIAMALIHRPSLLFLDEPTPGLDPQSTRAIRDLVRQMNAEGTTIFLTTHQIEEANQLCDRVAIIDHGRIAAIDTPERLKQAFQKVQSVEVAFEPGDGGHGEALAESPLISTCVKMGDKWRLYTDDPSAVISHIVHYAEGHELNLVSLNTLAPSLEDVFLHITGQEVGAVTPRQEGPRGPGKERGRRG